MSRTRRSRDERVGAGRAAWWLGALIRTLTTVLLVLAFVSLPTRIYLQQLWRPQTARQSVARPWRAIEQIQTRAHLERIEAAIEVYRLKHAAYPQTLDAVVNEGLIGANSLTFPNFQTSYYYRRVGESYQLYPPHR